MAIFYFFSSFFEGILGSLYSLTPKRWKDGSVFSNLPRQLLTLFSAQTKLLALAFSAGMLNLLFISVLSLKRRDCDILCDHI